MTLTSSSESFVSTSELMDMIEGNHLKPITGLIASIKVQLDSANHIDHEQHPELGALFSGFLDLKELYHNHLEKETRLLFPVFRSEKIDAQINAELLRHQILLLEKDHQEIKKILAEIREKTHGFHPDPASSPTLKSCLDNLHVLEQELTKHFFLEEQVLFPELNKLLDKMKT